MTRIVWDDIGEKVYETGLDRGVLYTAEGGVPWNGITTIDISDGEAKVNPYYFDGVKYYNERTLSDFSATLKAFTYPDEFLQYDGFQEISDGFFITDQQVSGTFDLSYRTLLGNDVAGTDLGYKLHFLYNLTAVPASTSYSTNGKDVDVASFSWEISGIPVEVPGFRPAVHFILDSRTVAPKVLEGIEEILYGNGKLQPRLPTVDELSRTFTTGIISLTDNGDGTWTLVGLDSSVFLQVGGSFEIASSAVTVIDRDSYTITGSKK
jgi:hypothetical protein